MSFALAGGFFTTEQIIGIKKKTKNQQVSACQSSYLSPAIVLVLSPGACLVIQQGADQGGGLLGVRAQVGRQDGVGGRRSSLRVDGQL